MQQRETKQSVKLKTVTYIRTVKDNSK